jgi:uncharacterized membrane protein
MEKRSEPLPIPRIQTLSDLIFGLALSIGAITLIGRQPEGYQQVIFSLGLYGWSFLILIMVWRAYSSVISVLPVETEGLINLNIVLLFLVSIEPYILSQVLRFTDVDWDVVSTLFALDLGSMFAILAYFNNALADEEKKLVPEGYLRRIRLSRDLQLLTMAIFIASIAPVFFSTVAVRITIGGVDRGIPLRAVLWVFTLFLTYAIHLVEGLLSRIHRGSPALK